MAISSAAPLCTKMHATFAVRPLCRKAGREPPPQRYIAAGDYYWNSGMFAFQAGTFLAELERLEPDMLAHCRAAIRKRQTGFRLFPAGGQANSRPANPSPSTMR